MKPAERETHRQGIRRRWRIPPPLVQDARAPGPEGLVILQEFRNELGAVLWKSLRSVLLWASADPAARGELFDDDTADRRLLEILALPADEHASARQALEDLLPILSNPHGADPEYIGVACNRIATWAERHGAHRTQLEFLQAAAISCPGNAWFALGVGSCARDLARYAAAEAWYFRAIGLARQSSDWEAYVKAYLNHGIMMFRRGALPAARRSMLKALRRSRRQGIREGQAKSLHDLSAVEFRSGDLPRALEYSAMAMDAYGPGHETLPRLAHDIAYYWLELGDCAHALAVFYETLPRVGARERPTVLGSLARAAAGTGDLAAYRWARRELQDHGAEPGVAEAWVDIARAAMTLDLPVEAEESARLAESVARERREGQMRFLAEEIMERLARQEAAPGPEEQPVTEESTAPRSDDLARRLIRSLRSGASPAEERPGVPALTQA